MQLFLNSGSLPHHSTVSKYLSENFFLRSLPSSGWARNQLRFSSCTHPLETRALMMPAFGPRLSSFMKAGRRIARVRIPTVRSCCCHDLQRSRMVGRPRKKQPFEQNSAYPFSSGELSRSKNPMSLAKLPLMCSYHMASLPPSPNFEVPPQPQHCEAKVRLLSTLIPDSSAV